jgi:hypothetical protein
MNGKRAVSISGRERLLNPLEFFILFSTFDVARNRLLDAVFEFYLSSVNFYIHWTLIVNVVPHKSEP